MNTKGFITKIINMGKNQITQKITLLHNLFSLGLISIPGMLPSMFITNSDLNSKAQQIHLQITNSWYHALEEVYSKVHAVLTQGVLGKGVPQLYDLATNSILVILVHVPVLGSISTYVAARAVVSQVHEKKTPKKSFKEQVV